MKLLIISPGKLPVPATSGGAVETLIQTLIDENEKKQKHDITVISCFENEAFEASKKYKNTKFLFINVDKYSYKISRAYRYIINRIPNVYIGNAYINIVYKLLKKNKEKYDYIIVENAPQYALILKKKFNNLIFHSHNDFLNIHTNMAQKILNSYKKVFAISSFIQDRIKEIDKNYRNVYTLYNGVELDKFNIEDNDNLRLSLNIKLSDFVYLYTGRIVREKGVKELIAAFNLIENKDKKLVIVGDIINLPPKLRNYIRELKTLAQDNPNIIFTGKVNYKEIPKYTKMANVGVVPSIWEEPFALTVVEHMAVGNPVIVANSGAMPELVTKECAIIVDKDNKYVDNLKQALETIKINYKAYNSDIIKMHANNFNAKKYCDRFNELIEELK